MFVNIMGGEWMEVGSKLGIVYAFFNNKGISRIELD